MSLINIDTVLALSLVICGLLGVARGLIRQLISMGCCLLGFVFVVGVLVMLGLFPPGFENAPAIFQLSILGWLPTAGFLYVRAARIVHGRLQTRISKMDRALGLPLGLARGICVVAAPVALLFCHRPYQFQTPDQVQSRADCSGVADAALFPLLNGVANIIPFTTPSFGILLWAIIFIAVPSVFADLIAAATRSWRIRRSAERAQLKTAQ